MMTPNELLRVARAYAAATGLQLSTVAVYATGKRYTALFDRIEVGHGISTRSLERAASWFAANWPPDTEWPTTIDRPAAVESRSDSPPALGRARSRARKEEGEINGR